MMIRMGTISYLFADYEMPERSAEPVRRDTKSVGDRSELEVMGALIRNGYRIALPFGENHRYDLIADDGERLYPETKKVYLLPESELVQLYGYLRVDPPKNGQARKIRWARQFELA